MSQLPDEALTAWANYEPVESKATNADWRRSQEIRQAFMSGFLAGRDSKAVPAIQLLRDLGYTVIDPSPPATSGYMQVIAQTPQNQSDH